VPAGRRRSPRPVDRHRPLGGLRGHSVEQVACASEMNETGSQAFAADSRGERLARERGKEHLREERVRRRWVVDPSAQQAAAASCGGSAADHRLPVRKRKEMGKHEDGPLMTGVFCLKKFFNYPSTIIEVRFRPSFPESDVGHPSTSKTLCFKSLGCVELVSQNGALGHCGAHMFFLLSQTYPPPPSLYLSIFSPARPAGPARTRPAPGPPANPTGRVWVEILKPAKKFWPELSPKCCF
jgi:hypothetical protein